MLTWTAKDRKLCLRPVLTLKYTSNVSFRMCLPLRRIGDDESLEYDYSMDSKYTSKAYKLGSHACDHRSLTNTVPLFEPGPEFRVYSGSDGYDNFLDQPFLCPVRNHQFHYYPDVGVCNFSKRQNGLLLRYVASVEKYRDDIYIVPYLYGASAGYGRTSSIKSRFYIYHVDERGDWTLYDTVTHTVNNKYLYNVIALGKFQRYYDAYIDEVYAKCRELAASHSVREIPLATDDDVAFDIGAPSDKLLDSLISDLKKFSYIASLSIQPPSYDDYGQLVAKAVQDCQYIDINTVAYIRDLKETFGEVGEVIKLLKNIKNPKQWASVFLSSKYGTRLTLADSKELCAGFSKWCKSTSKYLLNPSVRAQSRSTVKTRTPLMSTVERRTNVKVYYSSTSSTVDSIIKAAKDWDLFPTYGNLWDMVPYSFVVDWFVNVGDVLEAIDLINYAEELPLVQYLRSYCDEGRYQPDATAMKKLYHRGLAAYPSFRFKHYVRDVRYELDLPCPELKLKTSFSNHLPELTAIVIQKS